MGKKNQATNINSAVPVKDEINVTSFDGQDFTIYHPQSRPSFRALMACWLASGKRLELRQAGQSGSFTKLDCWKLTDDLRSAKGKTAATFDKVVKRALASKHGITAAIQTPKKSKTGKAKMNGKDVDAILRASGLSAKAAKAIAAAIA